jgi:hypothetical protein
MKDEKHLAITQMERPTKCHLCNVGTGIHAMHPLYDYHGPKGRQLFRLDPEPSLVWVHSLCAFFLATQGLLYGCSRDGTYDGSNSDDSDDERSLNPELTNSKESASYYGDASPVHHFVYPLRSPGKEHTLWTKAIAEKKATLKCCICGENDKPESVLRIPLQCTANDPEEFADFKGTHPSLGPHDTCTMSMHVGCARWGGMNQQQVQRVYFFPGGETLDPIQCIYCTIHGEDVDKIYRKKKQASDDQKSDVVARRASDLARHIDRRVSPSINESTMRPSPSFSKAVKVLQNNLYVLPSLAKKAPKKKLRLKSKVVAAKTPIATSSAAQAPPKQRKKRLHENLDKSMAVSVSEVERPTLTKKRKVLANQQSHVTQEALERMSADLMDKVHHIDEIEQRSKVMRERKKFWKRELSELETQDFKELWDKAKKSLREAILRRFNADASKPSAQEDAPPKPPRRDSVQLSKSTKPARRTSITSAIDLTADDYAPPRVDKEAPSASGKTSGTNSALVEKKKGNEKRAASVKSSKETLHEHQISSPGADESQENEPDEQVNGSLVEDEGEVNITTVPNRWAHLCVGPNYRNEQFKFGEWDVLEII